MLLRILFPSVFITSIAHGFEGRCGDALGMESGAIADAQLSASSSFDLSSVGPKHARIRRELEGGAWCPVGGTSSSSSEWLEVDLGTPHRLTAVETQGRFGHGHGKEFPPAYRLHYWRPGLDRWLAYANHSGGEIIPGNVNTVTPAFRELESPLVASKVRIVPYSATTRTVCLRMELYGCPLRSAVQGYSLRPKPSPSQDWAFDGDLDGFGHGLLSNDVLPKGAFHQSPWQWLAWRTSGPVAPPLTLQLSLREPRRLDYVNLFTGPQGFSHAHVFVSSVEGAFPASYQDFRVHRTGKAEAGWVRVPLDGRVGQWVKLELFWSEEWLLLGEVAVESAGLREGEGNETEPVAVVFPSEPLSGRWSGEAGLGLIVGVSTAVVLVSAAVITLVYLRQRKLTAETYSAVYAGLATLARNGNSREAAALAKSLRLPLSASSDSAFLARLNNAENALRDRLPSPRIEKVHPITPLPPNRPLPTSPPPAYVSPSEEDESEYAEAEAPLLSHSSASQSPGRDADTLHYASSDLASLALPTLPTVHLPPHIPRHRLRFLAKLGEGEFGQVHHCRLQTEQGWREVAVKSLRPGAQTQQRQDFEKELKVLARLSHPNVVGLVGSSEGTEGRLMVLEFVGGGDLNAYLRHRGDSLDDCALAGLGGQVAAGLSYLHASDHVHRDIASRNCLVSRDGRSVKLGDFGMARGLYTSHYYRIQGSFVLPIRWMGPEALLQGKFTRESDVWSLGVLLWELWGRAAEQPFQAMDDAAVVDNLQKASHLGRLPVALLPPPRCPQAATDLMRRCWDIRPRNRPTAHQVLQALRAFTSPQP